MSEDGQRGPGSGGTAHRGRPGAGQARQDAGGQSPPGDAQDHAGTPRPDALIPALDEGQLAALREVGRERDRVSADPHVWRQALPADPSLGEYPEASEVRPGMFTRFVPVAGARRAAAADPDHERFRDAAHAAGPGRPGTDAAGRRPTAGRHRDRGGADAQAPGAARAVGGRARPDRRHLGPPAVAAGQSGDTGYVPRHATAAGRGDGAKAASLPHRALLVKQGGSGPSRPRTAPCGIIAAAWCQAAGRAQLGGDAAARASAQARASAASSTAASARSMAQAA